MRMETAIWTFPVALTLHNLEEAIWLPAWSQHAGFWMAPVGTSEFRIAVALFTGITFGVARWAIWGGKRSVGAYATAGFVFAILANVVFHVMATVGLREYAPGVATAVLVNLPTMYYLLVRLFRESWIAWPKVLLAFIAVPLGILLLIPLLFWVGRSI